MKYFINYKGAIFLINIDLISHNKLLGFIQPTKLYKKSKPENYLPQRPDNRFLSLLSKIFSNFAQN